jgi:hypothetical protein
MIIPITVEAGCQQQGKYGFSKEHHLLDLLGQADIKLNLSFGKIQKGLQCAIWTCLKTKKAGFYEKPALILS